MNNVVDLSAAFAMNKTAQSLLKRAQAIGLVADDLEPLLARAPHTEQRFLAGMIAWRIEGGMVFPASDLLSKLPCLQGLEFGSIMATAQSLVDNEVIEVVPVEKDAAGNVTGMGFLWPALERLLVIGQLRAEAPKIQGLDGAPLR